MVADERPLLDLLRQLKSRGYQFTAVTPATHALVLARRRSGPQDLRDILGWNRAFDPSAVDQDLLGLLQEAGVLEPAGGQMRATLRVASLDADLLLHSNYPTDDHNAVFFGPDTYRFARFIKEQLPRLDAPNWIVDMGAGSGAGAIVAAHLAPSARVTLVDVNPFALQLARINAAAADVCVETVEGDRIPHGADLVIANPPYMLDPANRAYRNGGSLLGGAVTLEWVEQALAALQRRGSMILYTGAAVTKGAAPLVEALQQACHRAGAVVTIDEIDPDVFGAELAAPGYDGVERIAAVGAVIRLP